jgi:hypothetical protein
MTYPDGGEPDRAAAYEQVRRARLAAGTDPDRLPEAKALRDRIASVSPIGPGDPVLHPALGLLNWLVGEVERLRDEDQSWLSDVGNTLLAVEVERLRGLLARLEWPQTIPGAGPWHICPVCSNHRDQGHEAGCWMPDELQP